jgi:hypothetical protein
MRRDSADGSPLRNFLNGLYSGRCWVGFCIFQLVILLSVFTWVLCDVSEHHDNAVTWTLEAFVFVFIVVDVSIRIYLFGKKVLRKVYFYLDCSILLTYLVVWTI